MSEDDKILFILGNGPSLKDVMDDPMKLYFIKKHSTFGMNYAFKEFKRRRFTPTYYGSFDYTCNEHSKDEFEDMVLNNPIIKRVFFVGSKKEGQDMYSNKVVSHDKFTKIDITRGRMRVINPDNGLTEYLKMGFTGPNSVQAGILMGYKRIVLLGCDCNYARQDNGVVTNVKGLRLNKVVKENVNEQNYWFGRYHNIGDTFSLSTTSQLASWRRLFQVCPKDVTILNCSTVSKIPYFKKITFYECFDIFKKDGTAED